MTYAAIQLAAWALIAGKALRVCLGVMHRAPIGVAETWGAVRGEGE